MLADVLWYLAKATAIYVAKRGVSNIVHVTIPTLGYSLDAAYYIYLGTAYFLARKIEVQTMIPKIGWV